MNFPNALGSYSAIDQLTAATVSSSGAVTDSYSYSYENAGNPLGKLHNTTSTSFTVSNSINEINQTSPSIGPVPVRVRGFTNAAASVTVNGNAATLGADNMFSLDLSLSAGTQTISIAATSGATTVTRSYTVSVSSATASSVFAYDANGNTLYDGVQTYDYDGADRLIRVRNGSTVTEFVYDGVGRRVAEWDNGSLAKQWVWCGTELCEERNASNTVTKRFFPQGEQISGTAYFYSRDHLGSVREMTDASGTVHARYNYDPFGARSANAISSGAVESDFGFTGDYYNATMGLDLTLYRAYNPALGRWLNRDPIGERGGMNLYGYCENNPLAKVDKDGRLGIIAGSGLLSLAIGIVGYDINEYRALFLSDDEWNCASKANAAVIEHLKDVIRSEGEKHIYNDKFGTGGVMGTEMTGGCGQAARNRFESTFNPQGWSTAAEELAHRVANGAFNDDSNMTPGARSDLAEALLDRQEAFQDFITSHR